MKRVKVAKTARRYRRPRCLKGHKHSWVLGSATFASPAGQLFGVWRAHLRGQCRTCGKAKRFHPSAALLDPMLRAV